MRIYLAGGMHDRPLASFSLVLSAMTSIPGALGGLTGRTTVAWADLVRQVLSSGHHVFDPRNSNTKVFEDYSFLDVLALRQCDLVIAYLELENPSGAGLIAEVAYAKGLGKSVLLINEKQDRYTRFVENFADLVFHRLEDAVPVISRIRP
jgi:hypothetical protein